MQRFAVTSLPAKSAAPALAQSSDPLLLAQLAGSFTLGALGLLAWSLQ
ncbi:hypothetical protein J7400_03705 [Shimia sp. R9_2]|nr:hypothetical protein [Shimia sp. R9_2]MBO9395774.1 hypothetical protein [Shimia sp. R9_2]